MKKNKEETNEHDLDIISEVEQQIVKEKVREKEELREAAGVISDKGKAAGGVLNRLVTVNEERRNILALANFFNTEESDNVAAALKEAHRYGVPDDAIFDLVSAHMGICSQNRGRIEWGIEGLTHLNINQPDKHKFSWRGKKEEGKPS